MFSPPAVRVERRRAPSADGTAVPYFLIRPGAGAPTVRAPTLLYGYGGFNIPVEADYRPLWPGWLAAGGTVVIANLRGGGEYGRNWYDNGRLRPSSTSSTTSSPSPNSSSPTASPGTSSWPCTVAATGDCWSAPP